MIRDDFKVSRDVMGLDIGFVFDLNGFLELFIILWLICFKECYYDESIIGD